MLADNGNPGTSALRFDTANVKTKSAAKSPTVDNVCRRMLATVCIQYLYSDALSCSACWRLQSGHAAMEQKKIGQISSSHYYDFPLSPRVSVSITVNAPAC